jgi:hypothetical protein
MPEGKLRDASHLVLDAGSENRVPNKTRQNSDARKPSKFLALATHPKSGSKKFANDFDNYRRGELMGRHPGFGRATCEDFISIDVREWHRDKSLRAGQRFACSWSWGDSEPLRSIGIRTEVDAVVLIFRQSRSEIDPSSVEQRVWLEWTECPFGGRRPWFRCPRPRCGRRVAVLYAPEEWFACRHCFGLVYRSRQEGPSMRGLRQAQKARELLHGSTDIFDTFPTRPKHMRRRTYTRLKIRANRAKATAIAGMAKYL